MSLKNSSILAGVVFALVFGFFQTLNYGIQVAIITGPLTGLVFGLSQYFYTTSRTRKKKAEIQNTERKKIFCLELGSYLENGRPVAGVIYVTEDKLKFQANRTKDDTIEINLQQIRDITFFNKLRIIPAGLSVHMEDGNVEKFIVAERELLRENIRKIKYAMR